MDSVLNSIIQVSRIVCSFSVVNKMLIMSISYTVGLFIGINVEFWITIVGHWSQSVAITGILLSLARMLELKQNVYCVLLGVPWQVYYQLQQSS